MEGNDIGSFWSQKIVVVAEPTLFIPLPSGRRLPVGKRRPPEYHLNESMTAFIVNMKRIRNMPTEVWTFLTPDVAGGLAQRLELTAGDAVVGWQVWPSEMEARLALKVDGSIHTVYDSDADRVDRLWQMRGHRVALGGAPHQ